jgi:hypothetical protein
MSSSPRLVAHQQEDGTDKLSVVSGVSQDTSGTDKVNSKG